MESSNFDTLFDSEPFCKASIAFEVVVGKQARNINSDLQKSSFIAYHKPNIVLAIFRRQKIKTLNQTIVIQNVDPRLFSLNGSLFSCRYGRHWSQVLFSCFLVFSWGGFSISFRHLNSRTVNHEMKILGNQLHLHSLSFCAKMFRILKESRSKSPQIGTSRSLVMKLILPL